MKSKHKVANAEPSQPQDRSEYDVILEAMISLLEKARRTSARLLNSVMTATYWEIGRHIVEGEQKGEERAIYGDALIKRLAADLTMRFGRGFSERSLERYRAFYIAWGNPSTLLTESGKLQLANHPKSSTVLTELNSSMGHFAADNITGRFPLPWSHYVYLLSVKNTLAREFYEVEALRGGWSVRQLRRQIDTQYYERIALSKDKGRALRKGGTTKPDDLVSAEEAIRDPLVLEFLGFKDEYSESDLEEALIKHLETFLLELGNDFAFVGRQRRLRIDDQWYRVDLLLYHRSLRCLVVVELKLGRFTHADAGQMHLYLNYAREHWTHPEENPPVGVILCTGRSDTLVHYATDGLPNKMLVREYLTMLPDEKILADEIARARLFLERRRERT